MRALFAALALGGAAVSVPVSAAGDAPGPEPVVYTDDVDRFYALYDATDGAPSAEQIQREYLDRATPGLVEFAAWRRITAESMAAAIEARPSLFADARKCLPLLPAIKSRVAASLTNLQAMYPAAVFPPVTIAIGRAKTGAIGNAKAGAVVGLEVLCAADFLQDDLEGGFVHIIAHEYAHAQQPSAQVEDPEADVLTASLIEGAAEFVAERISGGIAYRHLLGFVKGREEEIEKAFLEEIDETASGSRWLYNSPGSPEWPADLGYWVGYRIAKTYFAQADDKQAAMRDIIEAQDFKAFLGRSGWHPGIDLP